MSLKDNSQRLDIYLTEQNLSQSRESAKRLITSGYVSVNGNIIIKPSFSINDSDEVILLDNDLEKYVSRGAYKLERALEYFSVDVTDFLAVDFGASTGGFTDVLLQKGAKHVYAIENGYGQLHSKLLNDSRVTSFDNTNARYIEEGFVPKCDIAVMDVSFISQTLLYQSVINVLKPDGKFISLIKPQFEAGRSLLGKKAVIKDPSVHKDVIEEIKSQAELFGFTVIGIIDSPILGGDGNKEFLAYFKF